MKRLLPILILSLACTLVFARKDGNGKVHNAKETHLQELALMHNIEANCEILTKTGKTTHSAKSADDHVVPLGSSGNLYTILRGTSNMVAANQDLNSVVFIHRNNPNEFGDATSQYRFDISTDGGETFTNNVGPVNTLSDHSSGPNSHGRYPQVAIHNPSGNTDANAATILYLGATHNGGTGNGVWDGVAYGSLGMDGNVDSRFEGNALPNNEDVLIPNGFVNGLPGEFWAVDFAFDGGDSFGNILLYKLVVDEATSEVSFDTYASLDPDYDLRFDGTSYSTQVQVAFDPSGMHGWIMFAGDGAGQGGAYVYSPVFWNTHDGGVTWEGPNTLNMDNFHGEAVDSLKFLAFEDGTIVDVPLSIAFDAADLVVDANGDPHYGCVITALGLEDDNETPAAYSLFLEGLLGDITYNSAEDQWKFLSFAQIEDARNVVLVFDDGSEGNNDVRIQMSTNADGTKVFATYLDSPIEEDGTRYRDLRGFGLDVATSKITPMKHYTRDDVDWSGKAFYATVPELVLEDGSSYKIPAVFTEIVADGTDLEPFNYFYYGAASIDDAEFTEDPGVSLYTPTPPDPLTFTFENTENNEYVFTIDGELCEGCVVTWDFGDGTTSNELNPTHILPNSDGTFSITLIISNSDGSASTSQDITIVAIQDDTAPVITLVDGPEINVSVEAGSQFTDPGFSAIDNIDGDLTDQVVVTGSVDTEVVGVYTLTYDVSDASGNAASATRTVTVLDDVAPTVTVSSAIGPLCNAEIDLFDIDNGGFSVTATDNVDGDLSDQVSVCSATHVPSGTVCGGLNIGHAGVWNVVFCVTDAAGNEGTATGTVVVQGECMTDDPCTGIEDVWLQAAISVAPNPSSGLFLLEFNDIRANSANIQVFNIIGEEVANSQVAANFETTSLDLTNHASGVYFIKVSTAQATATLKVVKK